MQQKTLLACLIGLVCSGQAMAQQMETAAINFDQETLRSLGRIKLFLSQDEVFTG